MCNGWTALSRLDRWPIAMPFRLLRETYSQTFRALLGGNPPEAPRQDWSNQIQAIKLVGLITAAAWRSSTPSKMMTFQLRITSASTDSAGRWTDCVSITAGSIAEAIERSMTIVAQARPIGRSEATLHDLVGRLLWMAEPAKVIDGLNAQGIPVGADLVN